MFNLLLSSDKLELEEVLIDVEIFGTLIMVLESKVVGDV